VLSNCRATNVTRAQCTERIFREYFAENATKPLELDSSVLLNVANSIMNKNPPTKEMFKGAKLEVAEMLYKKYWTAFSSDPSNAKKRECSTVRALSLCSAEESYEHRTKLETKARDAVQGRSQAEEA
jgi:hypothetical protein